VILDRLCVFDQIAVVTGAGRAIVRAVRPTDGRGNRGIGAAVAVVPAPGAPRVASGPGPRRRRWQLLFLRLPCGGRITGKILEMSGRINPPLI
jgi:hypothetical protein